MTSIQKIDFWLSAQSEHQQLEFKEAKAQFDKRKLFKYCVAIANEGGGHLVLGVTDAKPRKVVGSAAVKDPVGMASKLFQALGFRVDIEEVAHLDGRIVIFHIPPRPIGTAYSYDNIYWMRVGEELKPMSEDQLRRIFAEGQPDWLELPATEDVSAQEVIQLLDTQTFFDLLDLPYPADRTGVIERLLSERLIKALETGYHISNLAALLLAKDLKAFEGVSRKAARVIAYAGESKLDTKSDTIGNKGYAVGFQGLVKHVMSLLPQNEVIEDTLRVESKLLPEVVVLRRQMTNQSLRERFQLSASSTNTVSQIITSAMEAKLIKLDPNAPTSRKYARYLPIWA